MAGFYDEMAAVALELIAEFGQQGQITEVVPASHDPVTGVVTPGGERAQTGQMILLEYTLNESGAKHAAGTQVLTGDKKILVAAKGLDWEPTMASKVIADGATWSLINIKVSRPAGVPLVYELHGRR